MKSFSPTMLKPILATCATLATGSAAVAGPYVNIESNTGFLGSDYQAATTELHVGYEGKTGAFNWYVQGGPSVLSLDSNGVESDENNQVEMSGKIGASVAASEQLSIYGEFSGLTGEFENSYGLKAGAKFVF